MRIGTEGVSNEEWNIGMTTREKTWLAIIECFWVQKKQKRNREKKRGGGSREASRRFRREGWGEGSLI